MDSSVPRPAEDDDLSLFEEDIQNLSSHTTPIPIPIPTPRERKKPPSLAMVTGGLGGLPDFHHTPLGATPPTPTQAMIRVSSSPSSSSPSSSSSSSSSSTTPTTTLPNTTFPSPTSPRVRALTTASTVTSSSRSPRSPPPLSFISPQVKSKSKQTPFPLPSSPQLSGLIRPRRSVSNSNLSPAITSPRNSPPPDFLFEDDPFANLTGGLVASRSMGKHSTKASAAGSPFLADDHGRELEHDGVGLLAAATIGPSSGRAATTATTTSRSTPTSPISPSRSTFGGLGSRSSFPSIAFLSGSNTPNGWGTSSTSQLQPQPPNVPRKLSSPVISQSPHHSSSSSSFSRQHHPSPPSPHNAAFPHPHRPCPAHQRPAFKSRPSLPSLNTLAKMNFVPRSGFGVKKVRKGKVGAGLPFEPWNDLDNSSDETSPVLEQTGGSSTSASVSASPSTESASTSLHELDEDPIPSPASPTDQHSSKPPLSPPSTTSRMPPPSISLSPTSSSVVCQPPPLSRKPSLPSQPLALGSEAGIADGCYGDDDRSSGPDGNSVTKRRLRSPPRSPTIPPVLLPPPPPINRGIPSPHIDSAPVSCGMSVGLDMTHALDTKISSSSLKGTAGVDLDSYNHPDPILAHFNDDDVYAANASDIVDRDDDDVDQFMDQFMDHYDHLDQEEFDNKSVINETQMQLPPRPQSPTPSVTVAAATSLIEMARAISVSDLSSMAPSAFPDSIAADFSSAILAPTLRTRTRTARTINTASIATSVIMDSEVDDSSDSYSYTHPYPPPRRNGETGVESERTLFVSTSSTSGLTPPLSAWDSRWSPSDSTSVSRSRSLSSTYTTLSFESESEVSCPRSSVNGDDEVHFSSRYGNNIRHHQPLTRIIQSPMLMKSAEEATDTILHPQVSVLGSPPPLSMPFSGNEDTGYIVSAGSIPTLLHGPLSSNTNHHEEEELSDNQVANVSSTNDVTTYFNYHEEGDNDVHTEDRAGESAGEDSDPLQRSEQHSAVSKLWVDGESDKKGMSNGLDHSSDIVSQEREEEEIMKYELAAEMAKTGVDDDLEADIGNEVEWECVIGTRSFVDNHIGSNTGVACGDERSGGRQATETIPIMTPHALSEPVNDLKLVTPPPLSTTTSLTTPTMTQQFMSSTSDGLDLDCSSSTAIAAALAMSPWKQDTYEGVEGFSTARGGNGDGDGNSSVHESGGSISHGIHGVPSDLNPSPFEWEGHNERRERGNIVDDDDNERKERIVLAREKRGDQPSPPAISSSSSSSSDDDGDHHGPASSSPSQLVMNVNQSSRTRSISTTPSAGYASPPTRLPPPGNGVGGSRFHELEDENEDKDEDDEDEDDSSRKDDDDDDDDIPLAKSIPSALTAQKSIRRQVRQERVQRKQEKALRDQAETARTRFITLRPAVPSASHDATPVTSQTTAAIQHPYLGQQQQSRQRAQTVTGKSSISSSTSSNPFSPEELARKLRDINGQDGVEVASTSSLVGATALYQQQQQQQAHLYSRNRSKSMSRSSWEAHPASTGEALPPAPHIGSSASHAQRTKSIKELSSSYRYHASPSPSSTSSAQGSSSMTTLRPMRSFHRPSSSRLIGMEDPRSVPLPIDAEQRISRSLSSVTRSALPRDGLQSASALNQTGISTPHSRSLSQSRSSVDRASPLTVQEPVPPIPTARISHDEHRKLLKSSSPSLRAGPTRVSVDVDKPSRTPPHQCRPTAPSSADPLPVPMTTGKPELVVQQRVFIGDMQRFNMVEIGESTTARDIIEMVRAEGSLTGIIGSGGWMVFEVAQDFGMERPIRSFEVVADVQASWNKDKMVNYLVLRLTPLDILLNRSAIPSSSPTHSGYVEWEVKRGKWSKRWMQLREHSIWLSKRDNGRDQVQLCSLSNFDAYQVTRSHRAPKPFAFAVKSTDNLSFFENTADYLHSFACSEKDGKVWMEKILVARSYVLFQERHVLFNPKGAGNNSGLSRAGTRKATTQRLPDQDIFEPGSLLSKQI